MAASSSASLPSLNGVMVAKHWPSIAKLLALLTGDGTCPGAATALAVPPECTVLLEVPNSCKMAEQQGMPAHLASCRCLAFC